MHRPTHVHMCTQGRATAVVFTAESPSQQRHDFHTPLCERVYLFVCMCMCFREEGKEPVPS